MKRNKLQEGSDPYPNSLGINRKVYSLGHFHKTIEVQKNGTQFVKSIGHGILNSPYKSHSTKINMGIKGNQRKAKYIIKSTQWQKILWAKTEYFIFQDKKKEKSRLTIHCLNIFVIIWVWERRQP